jgi:DNA repair protein SbcC/Rad50
MAKHASCAYRLPAAEDASRRKYSAQEEVDRASREIGQASRRQVDELRILIGDKDRAVFDTEEAGAEEDLKVLGVSIAEARKAEEEARKALEAIDSGSGALAHREDMARAVATIESSIMPWMRSRLAYALLTEVLQQFRECAKGPMLSRAFAHLSPFLFVTEHLKRPRKKVKLARLSNSGNVAARHCSRKFHRKCFSSFT